MQADNWIWVTCCATSLAMAVLCCCGSARAEGTAQLGVGQDVWDVTLIEVDVLNAGEVIHIVAGSGTTSDPDILVMLTVIDPDGVELSGSPFALDPMVAGSGSIPGDKSIPTLDQVVNDALEISTAKLGTYQLRFDNPGDFAQASDEVIGPFDISVTAAGQQPGDPALFAGAGRVHSTRWRMNAHSFSQSAATNTSVYVLTPTGPGTDYTWQLELNGLAGNTYDLTGNKIGLPSPYSGTSEDSLISQRPVPLYAVYLSVPAVALGGDPAPQVLDYVLRGPSPPCACVVETLMSRFTFESDVEASYEIIIDLDGNGQFDSAAGDVSLRGAAVVGLNVVRWAGTDADGVTVPPGDYDTRLSVRLAEFHFVGSDIETSRPGLRIFGVDPDPNAGDRPTPGSTRSSARMLWDDTSINTTLTPDAQGVSSPVPVDQQSTPQSTVGIGGLASNPGDAAQCGVNAHCWGNFEATGVLSPGNRRYIDTYVYAAASVRTGSACVLAPDTDVDDDGLTSLEECLGSMPTDPRNPDTDGDGILDGDELPVGDDPGGSVTGGSGADGDDPNNPDGTDPNTGDGSASADAGTMVSDPTDPDGPGGTGRDDREPASSDGTERSTPDAGTQQEVSTTSCDCNVSGPPAAGNLLLYLFVIAVLLRRRRG